MIHYFDQKVRAGAVDGEAVENDAGDIDETEFTAADVSSLTADEQVELEDAAKRGRCRPGRSARRRGSGLRRDARGDRRRRGRLGS